MEDIRKNLETIRNRISAAAESCGRSADDVLLVAVSKTRTPEEINIAIDAGATDIGENKVQEIMDKYDHIKPVRWHMIGHLQTNKVKYIIDKVSMIHSVDSYKLAAEIDKRAGSRGITTHPGELGAGRKQVRYIHIGNREPDKRDPGKLQQYKDKRTHVHSSFCRRSGRYQSILR